MSHIQGGPVDKCKLSQAKANVLKAVKQAAPGKVTVTFGVLVKPGLLKPKDPAACEHAFLKPYGGLVGFPIAAFGSLEVCGEASRLAKRGLATDVQLAEAIFEHRGSIPQVVTDGVRDGLNGGNPLLIFAYHLKQGGTEADLDRAYKQGGQIFKGIALKAYDENGLIT